MVRQILEDAEEAERRPLVGSARITDGPAKVAASIRAALGITEEQQRRSRDAGALFSVLRTVAERAGIYVLMRGDVGSHHSDIGEDVFRGFALADDLVPFVVINDNDAATARSFTLLHELAHCAACRKTSPSGFATMLRANSCYHPRQSRITRDCCGRPLTT